MTAQITHVRFHGYRKNEDIAVYKWRLDTGEQGESDRASMIAWMQQGNDMIVAVAGAWQPVGVVQVEGQAPFLCAHSNGQWTDGLLQLPMF
ncbi:MAG TPA: DUF3892 domain-containing protein [Pseudolysinimonas sp.]|jgi:hypothetical protein|nr:hypothetical protein [Schumannella sp.]HEV7741356.1 DUF3892 domain-containing protein [Pseudolysinimonas sp.]